MAKKRKLNKGQARRIKANQAKKLSQYKQEVDWQDDELGEVQQGLVISRYGQHVDIEDESGQLFRCNIRRTIDSIVCGDRVIWRQGKQTQHSIAGVVEAVHPRTSTLSRPDVYDGLKPIAANIDQVFIISAVLPTFNTDIIDRYLIAAEQMQLKPIVVLNKVDLLKPEHQADIMQQLALYQTIGYQTLALSNVTQQGLDQLQPLLDNHTSIFVGQSGVGKSTLVNSILPNVKLDTQQVSDNSGLGQHTTTVATLFHLPHGGDLIDSPGVREFGLWHLTEQQVFDGFIEFAPYQGGCKFRDCKHQNDPGCAITQAVKAGEITAQRYQSYLKIVASLTSNTLTSRFNKTY